MPWPFITTTQLENRLSRTVVKQIFDDDNDGVADLAPLEQLCKDASSKLSSWLGPIYPLDALRAMTADELPDEIVRLSLDVAQAMMAQRHPEYRRVDPFELMKQAERDCERLRKNETNLGTTASPPEPAANTGGQFESGTEDDPESRPKFFLDGTGDF